MSEFIILCGGCFWCTEALFKEVHGVKSVVSGYIGGDSKNPTYEDICYSNHAEAIKVEFEATKITLERLLDIFFVIHDPTTLNRQGNDVGSQYRSAIFYIDENQKNSILKAVEKAQKNHKKKIVTTVEKAPIFYKAEEYHQDYFKKNPNNPYCIFAIPPKMEKLKKLKTL